MNDSYTSQLIIVNVSHSLLGANVECASYSGSHVGIKQILFMTGALIILLHYYLIYYFIIAPLPPPSNVTLSLVNSSHLTFTWNSVSLNCQALHYKINTTNCGQCPSSTDTNSIACNIPNSITTEQTCVLTVEAVVCGNVSGIPSESIVFVMKGLLIYTTNITTVTALVPNAPRINITSEYSGETKKLTKISVQLITSGLVCVTII